MIMLSMSVEEMTQDKQSLLWEFRLCECRLWHLIEILVQIKHHFFYQNKL